MVYFLLCSCLVDMATVVTTRPEILKTFSAVQSGYFFSANSYKFTPYLRHMLRLSLLHRYSVATGAVNNTISGIVTVDEHIPGQV